MGPTNKEQLRELLTSRQFPSDAQSQKLQTPSDRMRERALEFGSTLFGLVPDSEYHQLVGNVLKDLVVTGEMRLCALHEVETEHEPLRVLKRSEGDQQAYEMNMAAGRQSRAHAADSVGYGPGASPHAAALPLPLQPPKAKRTK